jgi:hypothetical protein
MRSHAAESTHLYGELLRVMADDLESGGPVAEICRDWFDAPASDVIHLRLLAGLFRIVLTGRAPELAPYYPCLGGSAPPADVWPMVRPVLSAHAEELRDALLAAPQTNEVGRSTALLVGIFEAVRRTGCSRIRLLELGASAGLNLLVDKFRFVEPAWTFGPATSPLLLEDGVVGDVRPQPFTVIGRRGCDLAPVDAATAAGQLRLRSFVWPFHVERHERLTAAFSLAEQFPQLIDQVPAGEWLERQLTEPVAADVLTVVWQSITRLYWPAEEKRYVTQAVDRARSRQLVAHVEMEFPDDDVGRTATLTLTGLPDEPPLHLARVADHGRPVMLASSELPPP